MGIITGKNAFVSLLLVVEWQCMSVEVLKVNEIFSSIQGESTWAGQACTFVRLQGCPLRCHYCDTSYAFREGTTISIAEILEKVQKIGIQVVQITGGEPLVQQSVHTLIRALCDLDFTVLVETSGMCDLQRCDSRTYKIVDIKTPSSGAADSFMESNYDVLLENDEVKFVITSREDFDWAVHVAKEKNLNNKVKAVHFSPVMEQKSMDEVQGCEALDPSLLATWILDDAPWAHLQLQIHKFIWHPSARGV